VVNFSKSASVAEGAGRDVLAMDEVFQFEGFRLHRPSGDLYRRDESGVFVPIAIGSRALDVLGVLVGRPGDLVSRREISAAVWPSTVVEDSNLSMQIAALRRILDDGRAEGSCIQTISGRGYRFVVPVTPIECAASPASAQSSANGSDGLTTENEQAKCPGLLRQIGGMAPASRPKGRHPIWGGAMATVIGALILVAAGVAWNWRSLWPRDALQAPRLSIVVLPFANLGQESEQQYFADGVTEDLTIDMSRIAHIFVISRNTAFTYRNKQVDTKQIGRELGVRYVLEGSVRRSGDQLRVAVQLIDAETDAHLWAERFDRDTGDLLVVQNEITNRIAVALNTELVAAEAARRTDNPDALDYILRGRAAIPKPPSRNNAAEAISLFDRALALDPMSVEAESWLADTLATRVLEQTTETAAADIERAEGMSSQALAASPRSAFAHYTRGHVLRAQRRCEEAIPEYERALALNRNFLGALADIGWCKLSTGPIDEVIGLVEQAIRLSPQDPNIGYRYSQIGRVRLLQSSTDEAIPWLERARDTNPGHPAFHAWLASAYALKGDAERAAGELAKAKSLVGDARFSSIARLKAIGDLGMAKNFRDPKISALFETTYFAGLRKAGIPED
jgi:TolB-like protein/DNA-binding winged helix-turn-helix (wHTH) protein/Tfp pilus assembly protein PilF